MGLLSHMTAKKPYILHNLIRNDPRYHAAHLGGTDIYAGSVRGHLWLTQTKSNGASQAPKFLILPGFTEFCEKYAHVAAKMVSLGFDVLIIDWPGQGLSGHHGSTALMVHCDKFAHHIQALEALIHKAGWRRQKLHILAHSMGGHLSLLACDRLADHIGSVAMSAPMILPRPKPVWFIRGLGALLGAAGRQKHYPPLTKITTIDEARAAFARNVLTNDKAGYAWQTYWFDDMPHLRRYGASVGWVREAYRSAAHYVMDKAFLERLSMPMLLMAAEQEQVVTNAKISLAASYLPNADFIKIKNAKHELFNETLAVDKIVWDHLTRFWDRQGLLPSA